MTPGANDLCVFAVKRGYIERKRYDALGVYHRIIYRTEYKYPTKPLGSIVNSFSGGTPSKSEGRKEEYWIGEIPWVSPKDFKAFYIYDAEDHISEDAISCSATQSVEPDSVLVVVRSGKHTHVVTRFQGLYLKVNLMKEFTGWTVVREKEFLDNGNPRPFWSEMPEIEKVSVESEEFNQKFSIYTSNGEEAFYLLTPHFMEKLFEIERRYEGRCLFGFVCGQLHIAIDSRKDHFVLNLFEKVNEYRIAEHQAEIDTIKGIIELVAKECETTWNSY